MPRLLPESETFDLFWAAYPRKVAKKAAEKAWLRLKPDTKLSYAIIESVKAHMANGWRETQFIPHPATYLNGERWNDELTPQSFENTVPRYCSRCGRTASWHLNENKHGRPVAHEFAP